MPLPPQLLRSHAALQHVPQGSRVNVLLRHYRLPFYTSTGIPLLQQRPHHPHNGADGDHDIDRDLEPLQHHEGDHRHDEGKEV